MDWRVLGPLEVRDDHGELIGLGGAKQLAVLAIMLVNSGRVVGTDALVDELYRDELPEAARKTVQAYVARLRKALDEAGAADRLRSVPAGYVLEPGSDEVDSVRFERLVTDARSLIESDPAHAVDVLEEALRLWRGTPFDNVHATVGLELEAGRLDEVRLAALELLAEARIRAGRPGQALPELSSLVAGHPLRERFWVLLVLALYQTGRQAEALRAAGQVRSLLRDELGIEPGRELRELEQQILEQDSALDASRRPWPIRRRRRTGRLGLVLSALVGLVLVAVGTRALVTGSDDGPRIAERHLLPPGSTTAVGGGGSIWVMVPEADMVVSVDPDSGTMTEIPLEHEPSALAAGLGSVWVASEDAGRITRLAATTGQWLGEATGIDLDGAALAVGRDAVWVVREHIDPIIRVDPADMSVAAVAFPSSIAPVLPTISVDADLVWATNSEIGRIGWHDSVGGESGFAGDARLGAHAARSVVASAGAIWFSQPTNGTITRIDEASREVTTVVEVGEASSPAFGLLRQPYAMAPGPGGLWVALPEDGKVVRLDEATGEVAATLSLVEPTSIFAMAGAVWVLDRQLTQIVRIDPETCTELPLIGPGADLRGCDLSDTLLLGLDLSNADLRWASLGSVLMDGANLTGADLRGAELRRARKAGVTWRSTRCPDGASSDDHANSCARHLIP